MKTKKWDDIPTKRVVRTPDFIEMIKQIPVSTFIRMATKSGMAPLDQRYLVDAFRKL